MKAAVIGLGVEGKKAVNSLLKHGWDVYASDLNSNIDLSDLDLPGISLNFLEGGETFSIVSDTLTLDLGFTNSEAIDECDAIAISPSMFGGSFATKLLDGGNLLSDIVSNHKKMLTIGITGTNGKTTTVHMLKNILENAEIKPVVDQLELHPGYSQEAVTEYCKKNDIVPMAWSPLGRGRENATIGNSILVRLSEKYGKTVQQINLRFLLQKGILPIPKASTRAHMEANLNVFDFDISEDDIDMLSYMPQTAWLNEHPDFYIPQAKSNPNN